MGTQALHCSARDVAKLASAITRQSCRLRLRVHGTSMEPAIRAGDLVEVAPTAPERLGPDDIVMIGGERPLIHRVVRVDLTSGVLITRGDALSSEDPPAQLADVIGKVIRVDRPLSNRWRTVLGRCGRLVRRMI